MSSTAGPKVTSDGIIYSLDPAHKAHVSANAHPSPTDIFSFYGSTNGSQCTLLKDSNFSPVGSTPIRLTTNGNNDPHFNTHGGSSGNTAFNTASASSGQTWTASVYAKGSRNYGSTEKSEIYIFGADSNGKTYVDGAYVNIFNHQFEVTKEWQRYYKTVTFTDSKVRNIHVRLDGPATNNNGDIVWFDGLQLEKNDTVGPFNSNTDYPNFKSGVNTSHVHTNDGAGFNSEYINDFEFDSAQFENIQVPQIFDSTFNGTNNFSISIWFNVVALPESTSSAVSNVIFSLGGERNAFVLLGDNHNAGSVNMRCNIGGAWTTCAPSPDDSIETGKWYNYAATYDPSSGFVGYLNGSQVSTTSSTGAISVRTQAHNHIGCLHDVPTSSSVNRRYFSGKVGPIKVYDKVLTPAEVKNDYVAIKGRYGL